MILPLLARFNPGDISVRHAYTGDRIRLHSYRHKGYWFYGKRREAATMSRFRRLIPPGATVLEIGGHIGYVGLYLASLVGRHGRVYIFEPGPNNLPYLKHNTRAKENITVVEAAAGSRNQRQTFFIENLTGQNNSFLGDFEALKANKRNAYAADVPVEEVSVEVVTLDDFCRRRAIRPQFIKIDVEGFELEVLKGAAGLLRNVRPCLMVEIQADHPAIIELATRAGYRVFTPEGKLLERAEDFRPPRLNTFWLPEQSPQADESSPGWLAAKTNPVQHALGSEFRFGQQPPGRV